MILKTRQGLVKSTKSGADRLVSLTRLAAGVPASVPAELLHLAPGLTPATTYWLPGYSLNLATSAVAPCPDGGCRR